MSKRGFFGRAFDWITDKPVREIVPSTCLSFVEFRARSHKLILGFHKGMSIYEYSGVDRETFELLVSAPSPGSYFNWAIRNEFPYRRIQ